MSPIPGGIPLGCEKLSYVDSKRLFWVSSHVICMHAGLLWVGERLKWVKVLRLPGNLAQHLAQSAEQGSCVLHSLTQLEVESPASQMAGEPVNIWFTWLIAQAPNLTVLSATLGPNSWIPPVSQLKHLVLTVTGNSNHVFKALLCLKGLQTLCLGFKPGTNSDMHVMRTPKLEMSKLRHLDTVALVGICPLGIFLPETCMLSLKALEAWHLFSPMWESVLENLGVVRFTCSGLALSRIPPLLSGADFRLDKVYLNVKSLGSAESHLSLQELSHVRVLNLSAQDLYISLPSQMKWRQLIIKARRTLDVSFEDVAGFIRRVPEVCFFYKSLMGTWLAELCWALARQGSEWSVHKNPRGFSE